MSGRLVLFGEEKCIRGSLLENFVNSRIRENYAWKNSVLVVVEQCLVAALVASLVVLVVG